MSQNRLPTLSLRLLSLAILFLLLTPSRSQAQDASEALRYLNFDTVITLNDDGSFLVEETQTIYFDGEYRTGFAEIQTEFTESIELISVASPTQTFTRASSGPNTFSEELDAQLLYVDWRFEPTVAGETRTFIITYKVTGGIFVYPQEKRLDWKLFPADRSGLIIESASYTVRFPTPINAETVQFAVTGPTMSASYTENEIRLETTAPVPDGEAALILLVMDPGYLPAATIYPWQVEADNAVLEFTVDAIRADLTITAEGTVQLIEEQDISVSSGALYSGFRVVSLRQLDAITNVAIAEGDLIFANEEEACFNCFRVTVEPREAGWVDFSSTTGELFFSPDHFGSVDLLWEFPPLVANDTTTFTIQFEALAALQIFDDRQRLSWSIIPTDNPDVGYAEARITLPDLVSSDEITLTGTPLRPQDDGTLLLVHDGPVPAGSGWQFTLDMPANATAAQPSLWQRDLESVVEEAQAVAAARAEERRLAAEQLARETLAFTVSGIGILVIGLLSVLILWYVRGRDPEPLNYVPERIDEPPSDLPAGLVAFLMEEALTGRSLLAALFQLATFGLLRATFRQKDGQLFFARNWLDELNESHTITLSDGEEMALPGHLIYLYNLLREIIPDEKPNAVQEIVRGLQPYLPAFYYMMGSEGELLFAENPYDRKKRWRNVGQWIIVGSIAATICASFAVYSTYGLAGLAPTLALLIVGAAVLVISRSMPQRSAAGVGAREQWAAFGNYLSELKANSDLTTAQQLLDTHFAYAVALDVAEPMLDAVNEMGGREPIWTHAVEWLSESGELIRQRSVHRSLPKPGELRLPSVEPSAGPVKTRPRVLPDGNDVSLDNLSKTISSGLNAANSSVSNLLNQALDSSEESPFELVVRGAGEVAKFSWKAGTTTAKVVLTILEASASGGGSGGFSGGSSSGRSSSRRSSSRRSSSRRSSGGRRGFR